MTTIRIDDFKNESTKTVTVNGVTFDVTIHSLNVQEVIELFHNEFKEFTQIAKTSNGHLRLESKKGHTMIASNGDINLKRWHGGILSLYGISGGSRVIRLNPHNVNMFRNMIITVINTDESLMTYKAEPKHTQLNLM